MKIIRLVLITTLFAMSIVVVHAQDTCKVGRDAAEYGFWTWPSKATVKVYLIPTGFEPNTVANLLLPFEKWNAVSSISGSGVKFEYAGETTTAMYCESCLTIKRGPVFDKTKRHATELQAYSANADQIITWAHIVIDPILTNPNALTNAMAHELGHNFGLRDCYSCKPKSTVMIQFKVINTSNDMEGPTDCDVAQVKAAYKELAVRVRPAPRKVEVVDEGEEPEDDDTPVVVKKP